MRTVVDQVSLKVGHGEIVGLLGPNGAGKTTSFYMVAGLVRPDEGRVIFADEDITELPMNLRARRGMGYLPQEESIFRKLSVEDNLLAILQTRKDMTSRQQKDRAVELMDRFGITKLRRSMAIQLSGGEKRRLTIARALLRKPKVLILDDSTSAVDTATDAKIRKAFREEIPGTTKIIIAQRISSVQDADHILVLENGQIKTTITRAKEVAPLAEKMITLGKKADLAAYRQAMSFITREDVCKKIFKEIAPKYAERNGGYTRVVRIGPRRGDAAEMAIIQLV